MFRNLCLLVFVVSCISELESKRELPSFLKPCHRNDQLNECIKKVMIDLKPELAKGIPAMKIPPLDPIVVPKLDTSQDNINLIFSDYKLRPVQDYTINNVQMDLEKCELLLDLAYPDIISYGDYHVKGQLLLFQLDGEGKVFLNFTDTSLQSKMKCDIITKKGEKYLDFTSADSTVKIGDFRLDLTDLFKDNPELTKNTVAVFNENRQELLKQFEKVVSVAVGDEIALQLIQGVFRSFPLDVIIPP